MRKYLWMLVAWMCLGVIGAVAKEVKQPDSYAYTRGVEAYMDNNYQEAFDWFNRELADHPDNGYAHLYLGTLRYLNEEYGKALNEVDLALKKIPKKDKKWLSLSHITRAKVYTAMEDTVSALNDLTQAIKIEPKDPEIYEERAQIYYLQKNYDLAEADYDQIISLDPSGFTGYMGKGRNALKQDRYNAALEQFNYVLKLYPNYSSGYAFRAEAYVGLEKWNEATDDIIEALEINGDDKAFYWMTNLPEEATQLLKAKLKIQMAKEPNNRYWPYCLGIVAQENEDYEDAIKYFQEAYNLDANSILLKNIAQCYYDLSQYDNALEYAERSLAMEPDDLGGLDLKADILSRMGRFEESLVERDKIVAKYPQSFLSYLNRADDLMNARKYKEAIEDYTTATVILPGLKEYPYLLMRRGDAYRFTGKPELASIDYKHLLMAEKDSVLTSDSWTPFAHSGLGDADEAVKTMQFILDNYPEEKAGNLYNMACIYSRTGRKDDAVKTLKMAIENGYDEYAHIKTDYDLDNIREEPGYISIIKEIEAMKSTERSEPGEIEEASYEVVEIPFTKEGGVTKVKCQINDLPLHFVFDTGAADVTLSMIEANFMLKNDYIKPSDVIGAARYVDANGDINEGTVINLRKVNFGGLELDNVRASVVRNQKAPLLLGQSVLGRLGKIEIDNARSMLKITHRVK